MKALVFCIFFSLSIASFGQFYIDMTMSVRDEETDQLLDHVWVRFFKGDELIDSDSSGTMWGHLKGFWLESGNKYRFVISKEGYVTKMGEVDLTNADPGKLDKDIHLSLFVTLFPDCEIGDYAFLETTPLIKLFVNSEGEQDWDREYVKKMQKRIQDASHTNISDADYSKYIALYAEGRNLMQQNRYKESMETLLEAQKLVDCYPVQRAILECNERKEGLYDKDILLDAADKKFTEHAFDDALRYYNRLSDLFEFEAEQSRLIEQRIGYLKWIILAEEYLRKKDLESARYYYEEATYSIENDSYAKGRIAMINKILEKQ